MKFSNIFFVMLAGVFLILTACNKNKDDFFYDIDMLPITVKGYNGSNESLKVSVDTFKFKGDLDNGTFDLTEAYTFSENQHSLNLKITGKETGKLLLEKTIKKGDGPVTISFFYMNGQVGDMPVKPAVEEGKIKLTYMFMPTVTNYSQPVDIVLGKYYFIPKVFEEVARIKNVKPNEFSVPITFPTFSTAGQQYNGQPTPVLFKAYIYKAGTNEFYTKGTEYTWHPTSSAAPTPAASRSSSKLYIFSEIPEENSMRFTTNLEL